MNCVKFPVPLLMCLPLSPCITGCELVKLPLRQLFSLTPSHTTVNEISELIENYTVHPTIGTDSNSMGILEQKFSNQKSPFPINNCKFAMLSRLAFLRTIIYYNTRMLTIPSLQQTFTTQCFRVHYQFMERVECNNV